MVFLPRSLRVLAALTALFGLSACSFFSSRVGGASLRSHGPAIHGYGPIVFGASRQDAHRAVMGKGRFEAAPDTGETVLVYMDYLDYMQVRVVQHFDGSDKAAKAEVYVADAMNSPQTLHECRGTYNTLYGRLHSQYGAPDWTPRSEARRYGEGGVLMYTFADGSNIQLNYDFASQDPSDRTAGLCTVRMTISPSAFAGGEEEE